VARECEDRKYHFQWTSPQPRGDGVTQQEKEPRVSEPKMNTYTAMMTCLIEGLVGIEGPTDEASARRNGVQLFDRMEIVNAINALASTVDWVFYVQLVSAVARIKKISAARVVAVVRAPLSVDEALSLFDLTWETVAKEVRRTQPAREALWGMCAEAHTEWSDIWSFASSVEKGLGGA
jgi:hypothetical protein